MARHYKKNRVSWKGKSKYDIYLAKRQKLKNEGFRLRDALDEEEFYRLYENAKKAGIKNFMRDLPNSERYINKKLYYKIRRELNELEDTEENIEMRNYYKSISFEEAKDWNNQDWAIFRDAFVKAGGTFEEFRGIYE